MMNALLIALNTLKVTFKKRSNVILYLVLPVVSILFIFYINVGFSSSIRLGICNKDNSRISKDLVSYLDQTDRFSIINLKENEINKNVSESKVDCAIMIPENFSKYILEGKVEKLTVISIKGEDITKWVDNYMNYYIDNIMLLSKASGGNKVDFDKMYDGFRKEKLKLDVKKLKDVTSVKYTTVQGIGFLIMFLMMGASTTANFIISEKRNRTYFRICSAPVSSSTYVLGNVIANIGILLVQVVATVLFLAVGLHVETYVSIPVLIGVLMLFGLVIVGLGLLIVSFSKTSYQASSMSTLIITPTCMLAGCYWPVSIMPPSIVKISYFMPQRWALDTIEKLQGGAGMSDIGMNILILVAFAVVFFLIAAYRFKANDDVKNFV